LAPVSVWVLVLRLAPVSVWVLVLVLASRLAPVSVWVLVLVLRLAPVSESASGLGWEPLG